MALEEVKELHQLQSEEQSKVDKVLQISADCGRESNLPHRKCPVELPRKPTTKSQAGSRQQTRSTTEPRQDPPPLPLCGRIEEPKSRRLSPFRQIPKPPQSQDR